MQKEDLYFMMDSSDSDNKESIIDFMLSWTLRMSCVQNDHDNSIDFCTKILSKMIFDNYHEIHEKNLSIQSVNTWRQWKRIDLSAEIVLVDRENNASKHALLIENKAYSCIHHDQLNRYKEIFEEHYKGTDYENNLHYVYFTIKERARLFEDETSCKCAEFLCLTMDEIRDYLWVTTEDLIPTGNDIFDEFWIKNWG